MKFGMSLASVACFVPPLVLAGQQPDSTSVTDTALRPVNITGYATTSYTYSTHSLRDTIVGRAFDRRHNEFMLNVGNITLERVAPTDRVAAGFHFEAWFGQNAAVVKSVGLDLGRDADIWQSYIVLNLPLSGAGNYLQLKGGKMATLMGVEVGEDILNPNLGIGYQDIFLEPYTETGVELDGKFGPHFDSELRLSNGWDQVTDINSGKTVMARVGLTPDDKTLIALVGYTGPEQPGDTRNNRTGVNGLVSRKITAAATAQLQVDYGQEDGAATSGGQAKWYAAGVWLTCDLDRAMTLAVRGDYMNDRDGARTSGVLGFPANSGLKVGSATVTLNIRHWAHALLRPELRYDRSTLTVFNAHKDQLSFGLGLSYVF
jgi:Putative beta-barrel porin-2, OmpL-like. bbp2